MFYAKELRVKKARRLRLQFTDFSKGLNACVNENLLSMQYASMAYNFTGESGALRHSKGLDCLTLKNGRALESLAVPILKLYYYKRYDPDLKKCCDKILAFTEDKKMYYADIYGESAVFTLLEGVNFTQTPCGINYRLNGSDVIILCSEKDPMAVWDGKNAPYTVGTAPHISTMCIHYERLFATIDGEKSAVWFSDDLDPTNWDISLDGAGFIEMPDERGSLLKVIKFLDYVYIFRSYGISRLTAYAEQSEFSVSQLFVCSGKIYPDTVCVCGDRIIFLAEDGLYEFDGLSANRIMDNIYPMFKGCANESAVSAYYNGCYYLACRLNYGVKSPDACVNNTLAEYCVSDRSVNLIKGPDISGMAVVSSENYSCLAVSLRGAKGGRAASLCGENRIFERPLLKCWTTPETDFSYPDREKLIREIYVNTETDLRIAFITETMSKIVFIKGSKNTQKAPVNIKGKTLKISFFCGGATACIVRPLVIADVI